MAEGAKDRARRREIFDRAVPLGYVSADDLLKGALLGDTKRIDYIKGLGFVHQVCARYCDIETLIENGRVMKSWTKMDANEGLIYPPEHCICLFSDDTDAVAFKLMVA
jgi:hypothetical protein